MYDNVVDVPRLLRWFGDDEPLPHPALTEPGRRSHSLGSLRHVSLRPRAGGHDTLRFPLGHGGLIVMGGSCQRTWEHAVLKTARPVSPRISVQWCGAIGRGARRS